jgi:lysophospholipase
MINLTYAGTRLTNGQPPNKTACVTGFDQAGFIMGTSASLFNVSPPLILVHLFLT